MYLHTVFNVLASFIFVSSFHQNSVLGNSYTPEEKNSIEQIRKQLLPELYEDYMKTDAYLIPWLRTHNLDVAAASVMLRKSLAWRKTHKMDDSIIGEDFSTIHRIFPYWMDGKDMEGRPVVELPLGHWDVRRAVLSSHRPHLARYLYQFMEKGFRMIRKADIETGSNNITQLVLIMDLNGYNFRQHGCISCFPVYIDFITSYEANYPQMLRNIYLINCPRISEPLLNLLRSIMTKASSEALKIYGYDKSEWKTLLLEKIKPEELSVEFVGQVDAVKLEFGTDKRHMYLVLKALTILNLFYS